MWQFCIFLFFFFFFYFLAPRVSSLHGQCSKSPREGNLPLWLKELWFQKNGANPIAFFLPLLFCCLALMRAQSWETHCRVVLMRPWLSYGRLEKGSLRVIKSEQLRNLGNWLLTVSCGHLSYAGVNLTLYNVHKYKRELNHELDHLRFQTGNWKLHGQLWNILHMTVEALQTELKLEIESREDWSGLKVSTQQGQLLADTLNVQGS